MDVVRAEVDLSGVGTDDDERAEALRSLQRRLLELDDVTSAKPVVGGAAPAGAKGGADLVSSLAVSLLSGSVPAFLGLLASWRFRNEGRCTVRVPRADGSVIEFTDLTPDAVPEILARWNAEATLAGGDQTA